MPCSRVTARQERAWVGDVLSTHQWCSIATRGSSYHQSRGMRRDTGAVVFPSSRNQVSATLGSPNIVQRLVQGFQSSSALISSVTSFANAAAEF